MGKRFSLLPFLLTLIKRNEAAEGGSFCPSPLISWPELQQKARIKSVSPAERASSFL
jgi:hypothetical protein